MKLSELTARLQTLCHDGYSQHDVEFILEGYGTVNPEELELIMKSEVMKDGYIKVKLG